MYLFLMVGILPFGPAWRQGSEDLKQQIDFVDRWLPVTRALMYCGRQLIALMRTNTSVASIALMFTRRLADLIYWILRSTL